MPERPKRPRDLNQLAKRVVDEAVRKAKRAETPQKDEAAVRRGNARAGKLTPERRREIAKRAAESRWRA